MSADNIISDFIEADVKQACAERCLAGIFLGVTSAIQFKELDFETANTNMYNKDIVETCKKHGFSPAFMEMLEQGMKLEKTPVDEREKIFYRIRELAERILYDE